MDTNPALLPEPFSEKNIDGSPISKASEGRGLFRDSGRPKGRTADRRSGKDGLGASPEYVYTEDPAGAPKREEMPEYGYNARSAPNARETAVKHEAPVKEKPAYDTERFDPPVDEKPGMIPNPMKMPPVKKKSSLDYDLKDADYGSFEESAPAAPERETAAVDEDDGYGYALDSDSFGDYGYGDDSPKTDTSDMKDDLDYGYGSDDNAHSGAADTGADDYDTDYGDAGGYDSDYDTDYGSGSDISDDYY